MSDLGNNSVRIGPRVAASPGQWLAGLVLVLLSIGLTLATLEAGFRSARYLLRGPNNPPTVPHPELGWVHNIEREVVRRTNSCGEDVVTRPAASSYLVRVPVRRDGRRVLFLGDSTTHAHEVSTGRAYYDVVEALGKGRYSVWAAGVAGYGNLQEHMVLLRIFDESRPEIVVWQLDSNDVTDNVYELDRASFSSPMRPRPYLIPSSGEISLKDPGRLPFTLSHGARYLFAQVVGLDIRYNLGLVHAIEAWLQPPAQERELFERQGLQVLEEVIAESRRRYPEVRFIGLALPVNLADDDPYEAIFRRYGADYWPRFAAQVHQATAVATDCRPYDRHWNHEGNRIAGRLIAEAFGSH